MFVIPGMFSVIPGEDPGPSVNRRRLQRSAVRSGSRLKAGMTENIAGMTGNMDRMTGNMDRMTGNMAGMTMKKAGMRDGAVSETRARRPEST